MSLHVLAAQCTPGQTADGQLSVFQHSAPSLLRPLAEAGDACLLQLPGMCVLPRKQLPSMCALQLPSRKLEVELTTLSSNYHVELNPSDVGNNDRYVVQEIIKVGTSSSSTLLVGGFQAGKHHIGLLGFTGAATLAKHANAVLDPA